MAMDTKATMAGTMRGQIDKQRMMRQILQQQAQMQPNNQAARINTEPAAQTSMPQLPRGRGPIQEYVGQALVNNIRGGGEEPKGFADILKKDPRAGAQILAKILGG